MGSNPVVYWMDVGGASYYIEKKKNQGSQMGHNETFNVKEI
jgi:hypothetical protein